MYNKLTQKPVPLDYPSPFPSESQLSFATHRSSIQQEFLDIFTLSAADNGNLREAGKWEPKIINPLHRFNATLPQQMVLTI